MKTRMKNQRYIAAIFLTILITFCGQNLAYGNEAPNFTDGDSTTRSIAENIAADTNIGTAVAATDADNDTLTYSLGGTDAGAFSIVSTSGQLQTNAALDYETKSSYSVTVSASDGNGGSDSISVSITVTDVSEKPVFAPGGVTLTIAENTASGRNIGNAITATDPDSGDTLTYSLRRGDADAFSIDANTGQVRTKAALNYETKNAYTDLAVRATDSTGLIGATRLTIKVTDVNENRAPVFTDGDSTTRSIAENTASGQNIGTAVAATDADTDDTLTYTLSGTDAAAFSIVNTTGQLQTNADLDYETKSSYAVTVSVSDGNGGSDSIDVTITVTDVNENRAPVFTDGNSATRAIAENTALGQSIGSAISATDADNDTLIYTLGGTDAAAFSINGTTGQLRTRAALDYETKNAYAVTVSVSDGKGGSDSIDVTINVTDVNENPPVFTDGDSTTRSIAENTAPGVNIGTPVAATDADNDTLTYSLSGPDVLSFRIISTSGQLYTHAPLDYETKRSYTVIIFVDDGNDDIDRITVTINVTDVNDNRAPLFTDGDSTTRSIAENTAPGVNIGTPVTATDADNDTLTYSLGGTDAESFSIVSTTGQLQTNTALDYETKTSYSVAVSVSDSNGESDSIPVTITVTDVGEKPVFAPGGITLTIAENTDSGTNIGAPITATDPDSGDTLTYSLRPDDKDAFSIDANTGQLRTKAPLDYETKDAYTDLAVRATDSTGLTGATRVTINVTDVSENRAPVFTDGSSTTRSIAENTAGENIGTAVAATDADNDVLTYTLGGTDAAAFSIVSTSGQLQTNASLDYETKSSYSVSVSVSDGNGGSDGITVTINVTDVIEVDVIETAVTPSLSERTPAVRDAIVAAVSGVDNADDVTSAHLAVITRLNLYSKGITSLKSGDFNGLTALTTLDLVDNSISDISPLEDLTALQYLDLEDNSISDITPLKDLTALQYLDLSYNSISDISPLEDLTALQYLDLSYNYSSNSDISPLEDLTALQYLDLQGNSISDISPLEDLTALTTLYLVGNSIYLEGNSISDISPLEDLTALQYLDLYDTSISDISPLKDLTALTTLVLVGASISDISPLEDLTALQYLDLQGNSISDISPLADLTALTKLVLPYNFISDISPLENLTALTKLVLPYNFISDISPLENLTALQYLDLQGTSISDISPLENLTALTRLYLVDNSISDISPLENLTALTRLGLLGNSISDISPLENLTALTRLYLRGNPISDYGPLRRLKAAIQAAGGNLRLDITIAAPAPSVQVSPVIPDNTALLTNFPNPFNPETWIPYQLAKPAEVTLTLYDIRGVVVRRLKLGYQAAGFYQSRSRAIHWDGRNSIGEKVASGVYFYTLTAGEFTATQKLLILK